MAGPFIALTQRHSGKKMILNLDAMVSILDDGEKGCSLFERGGGDDDTGFEVSETFAEIDALLAAACEEESGG